MNQRFANLGIGQDRNSAEFWPGIAASAGAVTSRQHLGPKAPEKSATRWGPLEAGVRTRTQRVEATKGVQ